MNAKAAFERSEHRTVTNVIMDDQWNTRMSLEFIVEAECNDESTLARQDTYMTQQHQPSPDVSLPLHAVRGS